MRDRNRLWKKGSRVLALVLAGAMALSLGADLGVSTQVYAAPNEDTEYICGETEHKHTADCYSQREKKELVCVLKEHTHGDDCYETAEELTCTKEEHEHSDDCYDEEGNLTCELTEHTHDDDCYTVIRTDNLTCDEGEHEHNDDCYETVTEDVLTCDLEEHTHDESCVADTEEEKTEEPKEEQEEQKDTVSNEDYDSKYTEDAEKALEDIDDDDLVAKLVAVAESQVGYTEQIADDADDDSDIYTLYSSWYSKGEDASKKWTTLLAAWCLDQAGFSLDRTGEDDESTDLPIRGDLEAWIKALQAKEEATEETTGLELYIDTVEDGMAVTEGDIIFLDLDHDEDEKADHVGIVTYVNTEDDGNITEVKAVVGDLSQKLLSDYAESSDNDAADTAAIITLPGEDFDADADDADPMTEISETVKGYIPIATYVQEIEILDGGAEEADHPVWMIDGTNAIAMTGVKVTFGNTSYDAAGNIFSTDLTMNFDFSKSSVLSQGYAYYYALPDGVVVPEDLLNKEYDLNDTSGVYAGKYQFVKMDDGTYRVLINLDESYVSNAGATMTGRISFAGKIGSDKGKQDGSIEIKGSDGATITIPKDEIKYPEGETNYYDISSSKSGSYSKQDGKITYTVYVTSVKGTPAEINFIDTIKATGLTLGTNPDVTVTKETIERVYKPDGGYWDNGAVDAGSVAVSPSYNSSTGELTMTLPQATSTKSEVGSEYIDYTLTYTRYKVVYTFDTSDLTSDSPVVKNAVEVNSKNDKIEVKSKSDYTISITNQHSMTKGGYYDATNKNILWTITVNANNVDIAGSTLTDTMLSQLSKASDITFNPNEGYEVTTDSSGKITGIKFTAVKDGKNTNKYIITYRTPVDATWDSQTIKNDATFEPGDGSSSIHGSGSATVSGGSLAKTVGTATSGSNNTLIIPWTVTLTIPESGLPNGTVIKDDPTSGGTQYMTRNQVIDWAGGIKWTDDSGNEKGSSSLVDNADLNITFKASDGQTYTYQQILGNSGGAFDKLTYTVYTITLKDDLTVPSGATKLVFQYNTTADISGAQTGTTEFKNTVKVNERSASATYEYKKGGLIKTDENNISDTTQKSNETGELSWIITAYLASSSEKLTITDELPDGVDLTKIVGQGNLGNVTSITIDDDGNISGTDTYYKVSGTYNKSTNVVTLVLTMADAHAAAGTKLGANPYAFKITCNVDTTKLTDYEVGKTYTFKNEASAKDDSGDIGSADQTQEWKGQKGSETTKVIDKSGNWDNQNRRVKYSILINPEGKDIVEGSELLTLTDTFKYMTKVSGVPEGTYSSDGAYDVNAYLIQSSVKLYKAVKADDGTWTKGDEIKNYSWSVTTTEGPATGWLDARMDTSTIKATNIPDSTPLIFEYDYQVEINFPNSHYHSEGNLNVSNEAVIEGTNWKDGGQQDDTSWKEVTTSGEITTDKSYILYKVTKGNYGKTLPGAVFKLQKYDSASGTYIDASRTYTSDNDGKITIQWSNGGYEYKTLYRVVETQAPTGYILPDDPVANAIYFYFSSTDETITSNLPSELPAGTIDLTTASHTEYVENENTQTEISVNKKWLNNNGSVDTSKTGSVTVDLYRKESTTEPSAAGTATASGTVKAGNVDWGNDWITIDSTSHPAGTVFELVFTFIDKNNAASIASPTLQVNSSSVGLYSDQLSDDSTVRTFTYRYSLTAGINDIKACIPQWQTTGWTCTYRFIEPTVTEPTKLAEYKITSDNGWVLDLNGLPLTGTNSSGEKVYYTYYVKEHDVDGYTTTYDNNGGITSGVITVINQSNGSYDLPHTGGAGTLPIELGGFAATLGAMFVGYSRRRRDRKEGET